jgi:hypothetical protein
MMPSRRRVATVAVCAPLLLAARSAGAPVAGPLTTTRVAPAVLASWHEYATGGPSRLAVLLTDTTALWLPLAHGLRSIGVPFVITRDYHEALRHRVVLVYPTISGLALPADAIQALTRYPQAGGTLIADQVVGGGMASTFGFADVLPSRTRYTLRFAAPASARFGLVDDRETTLRLGDPAAKTSTPYHAFPSYGYTAPVEPPLAVYDDGSAAITQRRVGAGHAYALGIDLGFLIGTGYGGHDEMMSRAYSNGFEPAIDVWLRIIRRLYTDGEPSAVTLGTVPGDRALSVMLTHDIDYTRSVENAVGYAEWERQAGITSTFYIQTKYIKDWNDDVFFDDAERPAMQRLKALGGELASHSVAHSRSFAEFPIGTGTEQYPSYHPMVVTQMHTTGGTVLGELRVSRYLVESLEPGDRVTAFRPGHLAEPRALPQALAATGYRYSSSTTAGTSLTHLPFALDYDRAGVAETPIFEFPITIEDEAKPEMDQRLPQALDVARAIARYGGEVVILIHPNVLDFKLRFEQGFVAAMKETAWFGTVSHFGDWWSARNAVACDVTTDGATTTVHLSAPQAIDSLPLAIPSTWHYVASVPAGAVVTPSAHGVVVRHVVGELRLEFR